MGVKYDVVKARRAYVEANEAFRQALAIEQEKRILRAEASYGTGYANMESYPAYEWVLGWNTGGF